MKISTLIQLLMIMIMFGVYFYFIEPTIIDTVILRYLVYGLIFFSLTYLSSKFMSRFKLSEKRIDNQLSVWIILGSMVIPLFIVLIY